MLPNLQTCLSPNVAQSSVFCVVLCGPFSFCLFSFDLFIVCFFKDRFEDWATLGERQVRRYRSCISKERMQLPKEIRQIDKLWSTKDYKENKR
jgi:hypothetical protein